MKAEWDDAFGGDRLRLRDIPGVEWRRIEVMLLDMIDFLINRFTPPFLKRSRWMRETTASLPKGIQSPLTRIRNDGWQPHPFQNMGRQRVQALKENSSKYTFLSEGKKSFQSFEHRLIYWIDVPSKTVMGWKKKRIISFRRWWMTSLMTLFMTLFTNTNTQNWNVDTLVAAR